MYALLMVKCPTVMLTMLIVTQTPSKLVAYFTGCVTPDTPGRDGWMPSVNRMDNGVVLAQHVVRILTS